MTNQTQGPSGPGPEFAQNAGIPNQQYPGGYPPPYPPPPYPGAAYGPYYAYPPPSARTNTMAILALVLSFVFAPAGLILGIIAVRQIRTTGEDGHGLAVAGIVIGSIFTALIVVYIIVIIFVIAAIANNNPQYNSDMVQLLSTLMPCR